MNTAPQQRAMARQPQQTRARERFDHVLAEARALLREEGLAGFSIPVLADRLDYTRASIYKFFPTPNAVLNELMVQELDALEAALGARAAVMLKQPWPEAMREVVHAAVEFYNANPLARLLVLGGPVSDESYRAQELMIQRLGTLTRELLLARGIALPQTPDAATLVVELGTTCLRLSQFMHGEITPAYREEAVHAMQSYLARYADGKSATLPPANG